MTRIEKRSVGSTVISDPVEQTESPIQTDFMKIGTTDEPASLGDTPPSSDSGVHSLGEQWENMSMSTIDMESEQNERPTNCSPMGRRVSDTRVPPNTGEDADIPTVRDKKDHRGPEVTRTFPVMKIQICSTDRSRGRRRHGPGGILVVPVMNIGKISVAR